MEWHKELVQGTDEWLRWRVGKASASEAPLLMKSPLRLADQWNATTRFAGNEATAHGNNSEPIAREAYNTKYGILCQPICVSDGRYAASLDGWCAEKQHVIEIKCPFSGKRSKTWREAKKGKIPSDYYWQVVQQVALTGAKSGAFVVWVDDEILVIDLPIDDLQRDWFQLRNAWDIFLDTWESSEVNLGFRIATNIYRAARDDLINAQEAEKEARERLLKFSNGSDVRANGVTVVWYERAGNVDYGVIPELVGVDLDQYRRAPSRTARISVKATQEEANK